MDIFNKKKVEELLEKNSSLELELSKKDKDLSRMNEAVKKLKSQTNPYKGVALDLFGKAKTAFSSVKATVEVLADEAKIKMEQRKESRLLKKSQEEFQTKIFGKKL